MKIIKKISLKKRIENDHYSFFCLYFDPGGEYRLNDPTIIHINTSVLKLSEER